MSPAPEILIESWDHLEQLVKQDLALTSYLELTQDRVDLYASLSFDHQWIHTDVERAKAESPFKSTISHGLFNLAMAAHFLMSGVKIRSVRYALVTQLNHVRFVSAVPVGSLIRGRVRLMQCRRLQDSNESIWMVTVERKGGLLPACVAEFVVRYYG